MNFIGKHIQLIGALILLGFVAVASALYWDFPNRFGRTVHASHSTRRYSCPMHPEVIQAKPGDCPKCGMKLIALSGAPPAPGQCADDHAGCCSQKAAPIGQLTGGRSACPYLVAQTNLPSLSANPNH